jgi:hypothetical protein
MKAQTLKGQFILTGLTIATLAVSAAVTTVEYYQNKQIHQLETDLGISDEEPLPSGIQIESKPNLQDVIY